MKTKCPFCKKLSVVKQGCRKNKHGKKQKYQCLECGRWFVEDDGFKRMRHKPEDIVRAIHLHNNRLSLFYTKDHLWQHDGVKVTKRTISQWTKKYSAFLKSDNKAGARVKRKTALWWKICQGKRKRLLRLELHWFNNKIWNSPFIRR